MAPGALSSFIARGAADALRSRIAELMRVERHKLPDGHCRTTGHPLHAVRHPVIPTGSVQLGHRQ